MRNPPAIEATEPLSQRPLATGPLEVGIAVERLRRELAENLRRTESLGGPPLISVGSPPLDALHALLRGQATLMGGAPGIGSTMVAIHLLGRALHCAREEARPLRALVVSSVHDDTELAGYLATDALKRSVSPQRPDIEQLHALGVDASVVKARFEGTVLWGGPCVGLEEVWAKVLAESPGERPELVILDGLDGWALRCGGGTAGRQRVARLCHGLAWRTKAAVLCTCRFTSPRYWNSERGSAARPDHFSPWSRGRPWPWPNLITLYHEGYFEPDAERPKALRLGRYHCDAHERSAELLRQEGNVLGDPIAVTFAH